ESFLENLSQQRLIFSSTRQVPDNRERFSSKASDPSWRNFAGNFTSSLEDVDQAQTDMDQLKSYLIGPKEIPKGFLPHAQHVSIDDFESFEDFDRSTYAVTFFSSLDFASLSRLNTKMKTLNVKTLPVLADPFGAIVGPLSLNQPGYPCLDCVGF